MKTVGILGIITVSACLGAWSQGAQAGTAALGGMKAGSILFLGNSITFCPQETSTDWWGLSASTPDKDYAHLLAQRINSASGGSLAIVPPSPHQGDANNRWYTSYGLPNYSGNILNMADIFERNFNTWGNARIQNQLDLRPDIVVVQLGENLANGTNEQFGVALDSLLGSLRDSSNPNIFVTGYILGANPAVDAIKRGICQEDPAHRVFVDMSAINGDAAYMGDHDHPSDAGMAFIANTLYGAMAAHSVPEPGSAALSFIAIIAVLAYGWNHLRRSPS